MPSNSRKSSLFTNSNFFLNSNTKLRALLLFVSFSLLPILGLANPTGRANPNSPDRRIVFLKSMDLPELQSIHVHTDLHRLKLEQFIAVTLRGQKVFFQEGGTQVTDSYGVNPLGWGDTMKAKLRSEYYAKHEIERDVFDRHISELAVNEHDRYNQFRVLDNFSFSLIHYDIQKDGVTDVNLSPFLALVLAGASLTASEFGLPASSLLWMSLPPAARVICEKHLLRTERDAAMIASSIGRLEEKASFCELYPLVIVAVENSTMLNKTAHRLHLMFNKLRNAQN